MINENPQTNHPAACLAAEAGRPVETNEQERTRMSIDAKCATTVSERLRGEAEISDQVQRTADLIRRVEQGAVPISEVGAELARIRAGEAVAEPDWAEIDANFPHVGFCSHPGNGKHSCASDAPYIPAFLSCEVEGATATAPPLASAEAWMDEETGALYVSLYLTCEERRYGDDRSGFDVGADFDPVSARALAARLIRGAALVEAETAARLVRDGVQ